MSAQRCVAHGVAAAAALWVAALGSADLARADDRVRLGTPSLGPLDRIEWSEAPWWEQPLRHAAAVDSQRLWTGLLKQPGLAALAHVRLAELASSAGDTAGLRLHAASAESAPPPWEWPALLVRLRDAGVRRETAAGRAALRTAEPASARWIAEERIAFLQQSILYALAAGDAPEARRFATDLLRAAVAVTSIERGAHVLDSLMRASGEPLTARERRALAAAQVRAGKPQQGAGTLRPLLADVADPSPTLRTIGEYERRAARWREARRSLDAALKSAGSPSDSAAAWLERARLSRAQGRTPDALAEYARAAPRPPSDEVGATALWERGQLAMSGALWATATESFARLAQSNSTRAAEARVRAGLGQLAGGDVDAAITTWSKGSDEACRFWWACGRRMQARARGAGEDTLARAALQEIATTPGYTFYRVAARDTLSMFRWPSAVARAHCVPDSACVTLQDAETLAALGAEREALALLFQVFGRVPGAVPAGARTREARLEAARIGYALGEPFHAVRWAREAAWNGEQGTRIAPLPGVTPSRDPSRWGFEPWMAPRPWGAIVRPVADSLGLEAELVWAVMELESRFQWDARSPSGATGLMQLLMPAASDAARWARERRPTPAALLDPASNVRYGARYLAWLQKRFDGHVTVALSAYNAGPSTVPPHWRDLIARGGDALFAEIASNEDAQFYAKWIVAGLRAYQDSFDEKNGIE